MNMHETIQIDHATKIIKKRIVLDDISMVLHRGGIYGFQGVNGSGKSMLFRAIAGLIHLSSGYIRVFDVIVGRDCSFPPSIGCMFNSLMWDEYTGFENLNILASVKREIDTLAIKQTLERVGLNPDDDRNYKKYSLGMKQRLDLAQAVMEKPELLILDEPSNALDSQGLSLLCGIIQEEHARGATILIAAHNTPELISLCDKVFELSEGRLLDGDGI